MKWLFAWEINMHLFFSLTFLKNVILFIWFQKHLSTPNIQTKLIGYCRSCLVQKVLELSLVQWLLALLTMQSSMDCLKKFKTTVLQWKWKSLSRVCLRTCGLYSPWNSLGQNTGVDSLSLLQGIFPTQGSNSGLLHCRRILYQLSHKGSTSMKNDPKQFSFQLTLSFSTANNGSRMLCHYIQKQDNLGCPL